MEKAKIVKFSPANLLNSPLEMIFGETLHVITNAIHFLVQLLGSQLSWKSHTNLLLHKLNSVCFMIRRLSSILNIQTMRSVYYAHFYSLVNYGIIAVIRALSIRYS
jgi:hypothetical protein